MFSFLPKTKMPGMRTMLIIVALGASLPSLLVFGWLKIQSEKQVIDLLTTTTMETAWGVAVAEQTVVSATQGFLGRIALTDGVRQADPKACEEMFQSQLKVLDMYQDILLLDASGNVLASGAASGIRRVPFPLPASAGELHILPSLSSPFYTNKIVPHVFGLAPDESNRPRYALAALVDVAYYAAIASPFHLSDQWTFSLVDSSGAFVFNNLTKNYSPPSAENENFLLRTWRQILGGEDRGWLRVTGDDGTKQLIGFVQLKLNEDIPYLTVMVAQDESKTLGSASSSFIKSFFLMLYVIAVGASFAIHFGNTYFAAPLEKFLAATGRFAAGELTVRSNVNHERGEIGQVARAFDEMADILEAKDVRQRETDEELARYTGKLEDLVNDRTQELEESQKHFALILDSASEGILELDMNYRLVFVNKAALSILEKGRGELLGRNFFEAIPHANRDGALCTDLSSPLRQAFEEKRETHVSGITLVQEDGSRIPVNVYFAPVLSGGRQTGFVLTFVDLTEVYETHEMMDAIYNITDSGYMTVDENFQIIDCNPAVVQMLKAQSKRDVAENFMNFFPPFQLNGETSPKLYHEMVTKALDGNPVSCEWLYADAGENLVPCQVTLTLIHIKQRRFIVCGIRDLRDQYKAQEALNQQREQLQNILNSTPIILTLIRDDHIYTVNKNGAELLGLAPGDPAASMFVSEDTRSAAFEALGKGESINNCPIQLRDKAGNVYETLLSLKTFFYEGRKVFLAWISDVTELSLARQAAEEGARVKSEFLASMSHEIRTPMNAILGMSHLCLLTEMTMKQENYLKKIHGAAKSLLAVINDILDVSKIEAGKLILNAAPFRLSELLKNLWDVVAFNAEQKNLLCSFDIDPDIQDCLVGDSMRLNQILLNLCNNAVKFTEQGKIVLSAFSDAPSDENMNENANENMNENTTVRLHFSVSDTGIGMTEEQVSRLFSPFTQLDGSMTRKYGGSGLGLSICKHLAEAMEGSIEVESAAGVGSTFRFTVTMRQSGYDAGALGSVDLQGLRVLVVDDDVFSCEILQEMLVSLRLRADIAGSGALALQKLREAVDAKDPYDFLFVDWRMPKMNGEETVLLLYEEFEKRDRPIIIMMSVYDGDECQRLCQKLDLSAFMSKPVTRSDLYDVLAGALSREQKKEAVPDGEEGEEQIDADILLVEDNLINQEIAMELLHLKGVRVDVANNGAEAVEAVKNKRYNLVFMDIQMPIMDGLEATRHIRGLPDCDSQSLPIVAMTAHALQEDYEKSLAAGMNAHLTKPLDIDELYKTLSAWTQVQAV